MRCEEIYVRTSSARTSSREELLGNAAAPAAEFDRSRRPSNARRTHITYEFKGFREIPERTEGKTARGRTRGRGEQRFADFSLRAQLEAG